MDALNRGEKIILKQKKEEEGIQPQIQEAETPTEQETVPFQIWLDPNVFEDQDSIQQIYNHRLEDDNLDYQESDESNIQDQNIDEGADLQEALEPVSEEGFLKNLLGDDATEIVIKDTPITPLDQKFFEFRTQETFIEKTCSFYLATSIRCLHDDYNSWNFTLQGDLILDIYTNFSQTKSEIKLGRGLETRVVGSKIDALNALDDDNWEKGGKSKQKKKKPKGRPLIEVDKNNILGGEGGLLKEEFDKERWQKEKVEA